jgi:hypothetical protein
LPARRRHAVLAGVVALALVSLAAARTLAARRVVSAALELDASGRPARVHERALLAIADDAALTTGVRVLADEALARAVRAQIASLRGLEGDASGTAPLADDLAEASWAASVLRWTGGLSSGDAATIARGRGRLLEELGVAPPARVLEAETWFSKRWGVPSDRWSPRELPPSRVAGSPYRETDAFTKELARRSAELARSLPEKREPAR